MRLLLIEDDADLRSVLGEALREAGYAVDEAADGDDGLFKATTVEYDAIVLDLMLPGIDGWELLHRLRQTHDTPVLVLSARDHVLDRVRVLDNGADDYLVKPFELAEVFARVRALTRRSAGRAHPTIRVGDVVVDTAARSATLGGEDVGLTAREYALVELLVMRQGALVTRTAIHDHLFDENEEASSNLVDVHVSNVRKKLGKDFIVTRRGEGYLVPRREPAS